MLIKVGKFIFLMDFVVMAMEEDTQVPLVLGRPLLTIGAALIDVKNGRTHSQSRTRSNTLQVEHNLETI